MSQYRDAAHIICIWARNGKFFSSSRKTCDVNGISMCLLKKIFLGIVQPLKYVCNLSLNTGVFPDDMKIERVISLFKAGNKNVFSYYRPVSILPQISKISENPF